ncbi:MAG: hypothetical protein LBV54_08270 [Puniceicoccales bacterium]|nr:hypothetical protein [Puniceicoccales bacterium]
MEKKGQGHGNRASGSGGVLAAVRPEARLALPCSDDGAAIGVAAGRRRSGRLAAYLEVLKMSAGVRLRAGESAFRTGGDFRTAHADFRQCGGEFAVY